MVTRDVEVPADVVRRLTAIAEDRPPVFILPRRRRGAVTRFETSDADTAKLAREIGLDAPLLPGDRGYLNEHAAGLVVEIALSIVANISADTIVAIANLARRKARQVVQHGLHPGPERDVPMKMVLTHVNSALEVSSVEVSGSADRVAELTESTIDKILGRTSVSPSPQLGPGTSRDGRADAQAPADATALEPKADRGTGP